jgi:hypothetical protein
MGFFSSILKDNSLSNVKITDEKEAFVTVLVACASTDDYVSNEEWKSIWAAICDKNYFINEDGFALYDKAVNNYRKLNKSCSALIEAAVPAIPNDLKASVFSYAVDLVLADGIVTKEEEEVLDFLKKKFAVDDELSNKMAEAFLVKNRIN